MWWSFWVFILCSITCLFQCFLGMCHLHLQGDWICSGGATTWTKLLCLLGAVLCHAVQFKRVHSVLVYEICVCVRACMCTCMGMCTCDSTCWINPLPANCNSEVSNYLKFLIRCCLVYLKLKVGSRTYSGDFWQMLQTYQKKMVNLKCASCQATRYRCIHIHWSFVQCWN